MFKRGMVLQMRAEDVMRTPVRNSEFAISSKACAFHGDNQTEQAMDKIVALNEAKARREAA